MTDKELEAQLAELRQADYVLAFFAGIAIGNGLYLYFLEVK